ncbi:DUF935 domain-containing protein [Salmonella enterica subsp. enterica]|nr:DUF935 domain-containing protein [Salmonella enterica subsp. enterica]ELD5119464.1 DUF935 domain-containing protein [Salmonella enterica]
MPQIVDQYGNPLKREALKTPQTVRLAEMYRQYPVHPSSGMTIRRLPRLLRAAEQGDLGAQAALFADMEERDGHIFAEMEKRKNALLTLDRTIAPPLNATAAEKSAAAAVTEWSSGIMDIEDVILNGLSAIGHGFSCQEIQWATVEKILIPQNLYLRPHYWFRSLPEQGDQLRLNSDAPDGDALWPFGWLVHRHNARSGFVASSGLFRVLVWPYLFKNYSLRDFAEFLEIYGLPARIAYYAPGASDEDLDRLLMSLVRLGHDAVATIPLGNEIRFENAATGGGDTFMKMIEWAERTESKVILGGTLTTEAGERGARSLGEVHNEVRHDLMVSDARQTEGMFRSLIQMMLAVNGYDIPLHRQPRMVFDTRKDVDMTDFTGGVAALVAAGDSAIPVSWVHKKLGIPAVQGNEPTLQPPAPSVPAVALSQTPAAQAALSQTPADDGDVDPPQQALDTTPSPADAVNAAITQLLAPMVTAIKQGMDADAAMSLVADSYPQLDDTQLRELLTRAIFVADLWGQCHAGE